MIFVIIGIRYPSVTFPDLSRSDNSHSKMVAALDIRLYNRYTVIITSQSIVILLNQIEFEILRISSIILTVLCY